LLIVLRLAPSEVIGTSSSQNAARSAFSSMVTRQAIALTVLFATAPTVIRQTAQFGQKEPYTASPVTKTKLMPPSKHQLLVLIVNAAYQKSAKTKHVIAPAHQHQPRQQCRRFRQHRVWSANTRKTSSSCQIDKVDGVTSIENIAIDTLKIRY
jgi:hypothetical protein